MSCLYIVCLFLPLYLHLRFSLSLLVSLTLRCLTQSTSLFNSSPHFLSRLSHLDVAFLIDPSIIDSADVALHLCLCLFASSLVCLPIPHPFTLLHMNQYRLFFSSYCFLMLVWRTACPSVIDCVCACRIFT
ncbi:hypothetical protein BCR44DRAFT_1446083 [Catenaria anguillulae PL171]|uniref:Uncharacterized protein n=1 Tax=Catenaria anguillulae PL171 TaxID=765915 RepID=A0A1Y2H6C9_9FUNG|nr:hypothetical protein BCR44DRAFT_1446083 [Catenaria anguillulae PL171]